MIAIEIFSSSDQKERYSAPVQIVIVLNDQLPHDYVGRMCYCQQRPEISTAINRYKTS
jgi:hypothetical protein